ncbi:chitobiase/beta-hexosaminidase C-terminal domain-containing protein [Granulicella aggregans]|uniref:chitobiase/beta-hexosaminidase C-terminal domain-containing protein n=1 Tax=Granulicella aggregans TaxID=474949 RepID=UPI0032B1F951
MLFLGAGDGTFTAAPASLAIGMSTTAVMTGDFNNDGKLDLALVNSCGDAYPCNNDAGTVWIYLGSGDGTFTKVPGSLTAGPSSLGLALGDFNGDGVLDLAVTNYGAISSNQVTVLLGKGDGSFNAAVSYSVQGFNSKSAVVEDFNGDGIADLAVGQFWHGLFGYLQGIGDGTFAPGVGFSANAQLGSGYIASADFNGDGLPDLVLPSQDGNVPVVLSQPNETVTASVSSIAPIGPGTHQVAASYPGNSNYASSISGTVALTATLKPLVLSVAPDTYSTVQTLSISESIPGATIYYQASGTTLNTKGLVPYTGPLTFANGGGEIIQAYATETGYQQSDYVYATYTLTYPATATPAISLTPGYYANQQSVTITDSDATAKIYYTTNGATPTVASNLYTGPITVSSSETVAAAALSYGRSYSQSASAQYVIGTSSASLIYSIAGTRVAGYAGDGGPATLAQLNYPTSLVKDAIGNVYFSDSENHMVRRIAAGTGILSDVVGNGFSGNTGDGGPGTSAELGSPNALLLDNGSLYISDNVYPVIRKLDLSSGVITTYAGGSTSLPGDGGPATAANIGNVFGLAVDSSHNLYLGGSFNTVRQINAATGIISTIVGTGQYGYSGDGGPASGAAFRYMGGVAFDASGNLYIADTGNDLIRKVAATAGVITPSSVISTFAGTTPTNSIANGGYSGDGGPATSATLNEPRTVASDSSGNLFIVDGYNHVIREVTASSGIITTVVGNGVICGPPGDGGAATSASLCYPQGLAVDGAGDIYVTDLLNRIREVVTASAPPTVQAATPTFSLASGSYTSAQSVAISDSTPGTSIYVTFDGSTPTTDLAGYSLPLNVSGTVTLKAIAIGPGHLVSSPATATYTFSGSSPVITTVAGTGTSGFSGAGGPASGVTFAEPRGLAINKSGDLYVSDLLNNVIWKIAASAGTAELYAGTGQRTYTGDGGPAASAALNYPAELALDSSGNLYVADSANNVVRKIDAATGIISTYAGTGTGYYGASGDGGPATSASLSGPAGLAFDPAGNLYIADTGNNRVRVVTMATGVINTIAGNGNYLYSGDSGPATSAGVPNPDSVAVDKAGNLYIGSSYGARIRKVTAATGVIDAIAGFEDLAGQTGDGASATSAEVASRGLLLDSAGNLYISNSPGEIRKLNLSTGVISDVAGIGYPGYSGDGGAAAVAEIAYPMQATFDASGNLYFADSSFRVRKVTFTEQNTAAPSFSVAAGTYTAAQTVALTSTTPNATIYYTLDGSTPTTSSSVYTAPIMVNTSETIKAFAAAINSSPSAVVSASYVLNLPAPTPSIASLSPAYVSTGSAQFNLTVSGSGFTSASAVVWGSSTLTTEYVSSSQLIATVPASDISSAGIVSVTVQTPAPGGGASNALQFEVDTAGSSTPPSFPTSSATVSAGGTATYPVTLPASATNISVKCLNLPAGAACSYSSSAGALTITTTSTTPTGTYQITAVFTETLPGAALAFLFLPLLLTPIAKAKLRRNSRAALSLVIVGVATVALVAGCSSGGGGSSTPPPVTHQVTSSGTVTLVVK